MFYYYLFTGLWHSMQKDTVTVACVADPCGSDWQLVRLLPGQTTFWWLVIILCGPLAIMDQHPVWSTDWGPFWRNTEPLCTCLAMTTICRCVPHAQSHNLIASTWHFKMCKTCQGNMLLGATKNVYLLQIGSKLVCIFQTGICAH